MRAGRMIAMSERETPSKLSCSTSTSWFADTHHLDLFISIFLTLVSMFDSRTERYNASLDGGHTLALHHNNYQ